MMYFEEPDQDFQFEKIKKTNIETKIRTAVLFVIFLLVIFAFVKNGYRFDFLSKKSMAYELNCTDANQIKGNEDEELRMEKAQRVLKENEQEFSRFEGFLSASVASKPIGYQGAMKPVIEVSFNKIDSKKKLPDEICGVKLSAIYK